MLASGMRERIQVPVGVVGQRVELQVRPDTFGRVQFGRIGREEVRVEIRVSGEKGLHPTRLVWTKAVPEQDDGSGHMVVQLVQEMCDPSCVYVGVGVEPEAETDAIGLRRYRDRSDERDLGMGPGALTQDRRAALRRPRAPDEGRHQHAGFVKENQMRLQAVEFFLMRGHSILIHRRMASSSRSMARLSGRWALQPSERKRRPRWER